MIFAVLHLFYYLSYAICYSYGADNKINAARNIYYGPVLFCTLVSVVCLSASSSIEVCNAAGGRAGRPPGASAVGRPTLHGGPVRLRPVRATPGFTCAAGISHTILTHVKFSLESYIRASCTSSYI